MPTLLTATVVGGSGGTQDGLSGCGGLCHEEAAALAERGCTDGCLTLEEEVGYFSKSWRCGLVAAE